MAKLKITLIKGKAGVNSRDKKILESFGLRKIGKSKVFEDAPSVRGAIRKIAYMFKVEEVK
jgi:large subunit ribosomal protein L30